MEDRYKDERNEGKKASGRRGECKQAKKETQSGKRKKEMKPEPHTHEQTYAR